jgi:hypothetical protein
MGLSDTAAKGPPRPDQIEVSVFGPSYGECVCIHFGDGNWAVIDSCLHEGEPIALSYLRELGFNPNDCIKTIVGTHWHDDHYKGLSKLMAAAPNAPIWIPGALTSPEFLRFAKRISKNKTAIAGNKLSEISRILDEISRRNSQGLVNFGYASSRTSIFRIDANTLAHGHACEMMALSPSHADVHNFLSRIAAQMPSARQTKRTAASPSPNDVSIAILFSIGPASILLGADLENGTTANTGWSAVLASNRSQQFGPLASLYKIPHHGSDTAHNPVIWADLLLTEPAAVLTPWRKGRGQLPTRAGANEILRLSPKAFATAKTARGQSKRLMRPPGVMQTIRELRPRVKVRSLQAPFGAVRFRSIDIQSGTWEEEMFGAACHLSDVARDART